MKLPLLIVLTAALFLTVACSKKNVPMTDLSKLKTELMETDLAFSKMCGLRGMKAAFLYYAADEVIKMDDGRFPIMGKTALTDYFNASPQIAALKLLQWKPVKADVSASGDMGYTFGEWEFAQKDTVLYGNYVSIWKKEANGMWKYVLDTGTSAPGKPH